MDLLEYQNRYSATERRELDYLMRTGNAAVGLMEEAIEVLELAEAGCYIADKMIKELGDVMWYCAQAADQFGLKLVNLHGTFGYGPEPKAIARGLVLNAGKLGGKLKKVVYHAHPVTEEVKGEVATLLSFIIEKVAGMAALYGHDLDHVCQANIEKLQRRYGPGGFSTEKSLNRKD